MTSEIRDYGNARCATSEAYFLGEGVTWDGVRDELCWVDIIAGHVIRGRLRADGTIDAIGTIEFPDTAGAVGLDPSGAMVVAGRHHLYRRDAAGVITRWTQVTSGAARRLNDGKPDAAGRFLVGTLVESGRSDRESLLRVDPAGSITVLDDELTLSNGLGWSADGRLLYHVDTLSRQIFYRSYDQEGDAVGDRRVLASLTDDALGQSWSGGLGMPDGMTLDAEGCLWVAMWGGGCVIRLDPTGAAIGVVRVAAPHVSSVAFAGPGLDTMVITTAQQGLSSADRLRHPHSGRLFSIDVGVTGLAPYHWIDGG